MEAGRKLDALVAEKVMGFLWEPSPLNTEQKVLLPPGLAKPKANFWWGRDIRVLVPHYSTDIAAAWLVVEKIAESAMDLEIAWNGFKWFCELNMAFPEDASTAPLAICLAALKGVGADIENLETISE